METLEIKKEKVVEEEVAEIETCEHCQDTGYMEVWVDVDDSIISKCICSLPDPDDYDDEE